MRALPIVLASLLLIACTSDPTRLTGSGSPEGSKVPGGSESSGSSGSSGTASPGTGTGSTSSSSSTGGPAPSMTTCQNPAFITSDTNGGWSDGGYYVHNNMWNSEETLGPETLSACSYKSWFVVSNQTNNAGAVKTYPNVHKDYDNVAITSFSKLTSTFAATSPHVGIYNVAYDIWINGVADAGSTEIMIWTENFNQVPAGDKEATATLGGRTFDVWRTNDGSYLAFVPATPVTSGTIDLLELFNWTIDKGWLPSSSTVGQICYGVEIVSTEGKDATWHFTDFSIADN